MSLQKSTEQAMLESDRNSLEFLFACMKCTSCSSLFIIYLSFMFLCEQEDNKHETELNMFY